MKKILFLVSVSILILKVQANDHLRMEKQYGLRIYDGNPNGYVSILGFCKASQFRTVPTDGAPVPTCKNRMMQNNGFNQRLHFVTKQKHLSELNSHKNEVDRKIKKSKDNTIEILSEMIETVVEEKIQDNAQIQAKKVILEDNQIKDLIRSIIREELNTRS